MIDSWILILVFVHIFLLKVDAIEKSQKKKQSRTCHQITVCALCESTNPCLIWNHRIWSLHNPLSLFLLPIPHPRNMENISSLLRRQSERNNGFFVHNLWIVMQCKCIQSYTHCYKNGGNQLKNCKRFYFGYCKNFFSTQVVSGMWHFEEKLSQLQT